MKRKFLQSNWSELRGQISEWWDDLIDEDLDMIDGNQEKLIALLQECYGHTRNLAFGEVKVRKASRHPQGKGREKRSHKDMRALEYPSYDSGDWTESNNDRNFSRSKVKERTRTFADQNK